MLIATVLLMAMRFIVVCFQVYLMQQIGSGAPPSDVRQASELNQLIGILAGLVSAVTIGLLLAAAFVGRPGTNSAAATSSG